MSLRISVTCDAETKTAFDFFVSTHEKEIASSRAVQANNLDGTMASWIVIATLSVQVVPHFLTFLSDQLKSHRVGRVKLGDLEIDNPTKEDLRLFREAMHQRLTAGNDHDDTKSTG